MKFRTLNPAIKDSWKPDIMTYAYNHSVWEVETGGAKFKVPAGQGTWFPPNSVILELDRACYSHFPGPKQSEEATIIP